MQLSQLSEQLKGELELFTNSLQQLRIATAKFQESLQSVSKLDNTTDGHEIMVPMTSSLYVHGKLKDTDTLQGYLKQKRMAKAKVDETLQIKVQQLQQQQQ